MNIVIPVRDELACMVAIPAGFWSKPARLFRIVGTKPKTGQKQDC
jgi:hypothetical protein